MPEENGNGKNGNRVGLLERVKAGVKEDVQSLKTDMPAKAKEQIEGLKDPTKTQVYTSIFRHKHDDTPRNRALGVLSNVFLHLHPAKINRDAVRYSYTWGMGGITFYLFIVLTFTGVLLMFYYHPEQSSGLSRRPLPRARRSLRQTAAQHAPLGRAFNGDRGLAAHVPSFPDGLVQEAARVQLEYRRAAIGLHAAALVHRLPASRRSTRILGSHSGYEHGSRHAAAGPRRPIRQNAWA